MCVESITIHPPRNVRVQPLSAVVLKPSPVPPKPPGDRYSRSSTDNINSRPKRKVSLFHRLKVVYLCSLLRRIKQGAHRSGIYTGICHAR